jgi:L-glyceraldehyde 3-phosphate reductase
MSWFANPARYEQMQYRYCGKSGLRLPALSLGLWHSFGHVHALDPNAPCCVKPLI